MKLLDKVNAVKNKAIATKRQLDFVRTFFKLAANPNDTMLVFKLEDTMFGGATPEDIQAALDGFKQYPTVARMLEERYLAPDYKVEDLKDSKPGTLGYAYYRHMSDNGFTPNFFPEVKVVDEMTYFELRLRQTHDIWHVIAGFSPSVEDEIGLQAFYAGQLPSPFNMILIGTGATYAALHNQQLIGPVLEAIKTGWENGKAAKQLHAAKWEEMWDRPLEEIRREFNVKPARNLYDFSTEVVAEGELALA